MDMSVHATKDSKAKRAKVCHLPRTRVERMNSKEPWFPNFQIVLHGGPPKHTFSNQGSLEWIDLWFDRYADQQYNESNKRRLPLTVP